MSQSKKHNVGRNAVLLAPAFGSKRTRSSLLVATALGSVLGIGVMTPQQAFAAAACVQAVDLQTWNCYGSLGPVNVTATQNPSLFNLGTDGTTTTPFNPTGTGADAFKVQGGGNALYFNNVAGPLNSYRTATGWDAIDIKSGGGNVFSVDGSVVINSVSVTTTHGFGGPIVGSSGGEGLQVRSGNSTLGSVANAGNITIVTATEDVVTTSGGIGILLDARGSSTGGHIDLTTNASVNSSGNHGISLRTNEEGTIKLLTNADVSGGGDAIRARAEYGPVSGTIDITTAAGTILRAGDDGIDARTTGVQQNAAGGITIHNNAGIIAGPGQNNDGIRVAVGGGGGMIIIPGPGGAGNVLIDNTAEIVAGGHGLHVSSVFDTGTIDIFNRGPIGQDPVTHVPQPVGGDGIHVFKGPFGGDIHITTTTGEGVGGTSGTILANGDGIRVRVINWLPGPNPTSNVVIVAAADIGSAIHPVGDDGVDVRTRNSDGLVSVTVGNVFAVDDGIRIRRSNGIGNTEVIVNGAIKQNSPVSGDGVHISTWNVDGTVSTTMNPGSSIAAVEHGIHIFKGNSTGDIAVVATDIAAGDDGIHITRIRGDGSVTVTLTGTIQGNSGPGSSPGGSVGNDGISIDKNRGTGDVTVILGTPGTAANIFATDHGIEIEKSRGAGNVVIAGDVTGAVAGNVNITTIGDGIFVDKNRGAGSVIINLAGTISAGDDGIQVIKNRGGPDAGGVAVSVTHTGTISAGDDGITIRHRGDGTVNVTANNINAGDDGIFINKRRGDGAVNVTLTGVIQGNGPAATPGPAGDDGIQIIRTRGDGAVAVTLVAGSAIHATDDGITIEKNRGDGDVSVIGTTTLINADNGDGIFVRKTRGDGSVDINVSGNISAGDDGIQVIKNRGGPGTGVDGVTPLAFAVRVINDGTISAGDDGITIRHRGDGDVIVVANNINAGHDGIFINKRRGDGNVSVTLNGVIQGNASPTGDDGIQIIRTRGDGEVAVVLNPGSSIHATDNGIQIIRTRGDGDVSVIGTTTINADTGDGVFVRKSRGDGSVDVTIHGNITAGDDGIQIIKNRGGPGTVNPALAINVFNDGLISAGDDGVNIRHRGDGDVVVEVNNINAGHDGVFINKRRGDGDVKVTLNGAIDGNAGLGAGDDGIQVIRSRGDGAVAIVLNANSSIRAQGDGVQVIKTRGDGDVSVTGTSTITAGVDGIFVRKSRGDGSVDINVAGDITAGDDGIQVIKTRGGPGLAADLVTPLAFAVRVINTGTITANDDGIRIYHSRGDGDVIVQANNINAGDDGIHIRNRRGDGDIFVTLNGAIRNVAGTGPVGDDGIEVIKTRGDGSVYITLADNASILAADNGIRVFKRAGGTETNNNVIVDIGYGALVQSEFGRAISINTRVFGDVDSSVRIENRGTLVGAGTWQDPTIRIRNDGGLITINNGGGGGGYGLIRGFNTLADDVIVKVNGTSGFVGNAPVVINNDGEMYGRVLLYTRGGNTINNNSYDSWVTSGKNRIGFGGDDVINNPGLIITGGPNAALDYLAGNPISGGKTIFAFNGGNDAVNNSGTIRVNGIARFFGLDNFNNSIADNGGRLTMINDISNTGGAFAVGQFTNAFFNGGQTSFGSGVGDVTYLGGNFNGANYPTVNSRLGLDVELGTKNTSSSDLLVVRDAVNGKTGIIVNDANPTTLPGLNQVGIPLVYVQSGLTGPKPVTAPFANYGTFQLDPYSDHFSSAYGGVLNKGLFFYHLTLVDVTTNPLLALDPFCGGDPLCRVWVLKSDPSTTAHQLPIAITAAQNIWYESALLWEDRQTEVRSRYLNRGVSAGGADMPTKARVRPVVEEPSPDSMVWMKLLGSWTKRENIVPLVGGDAFFNTDLGYKQNTFGIIGGLTGGAEQIFSRFDAFSASVMAGYLDSSVKFNSAGTRFNFTGATGGVAATYMYGGFFMDALLKADFLKLKFTTPELIAADLPGLPSTDALTVGGIGNIGWRLDMGRFFMEPILTVAYAKTTIDSLSTLNVLGADVKFGDGDSLRVAGGARFGASMPYGGTHRIEASVTLRYWDELLGKNNSVILAGPDSITLNDNFKKGFGEIKGGFDVMSYASGWSGFANAGVKFNEEQTTVTAKGGVNYKWAWK